MKLAYHFTNGSVAAMERMTVLIADEQSLTRLAFTLRDAATANDSITGVVAYVEYVDRALAINCVADEFPEILMTTIRQLKGN